MDTVKGARQRVGLSQRRMAERAGLSFRALQLLEWGGRDVRLSTVIKAAKAVGLPETGIPRLLDRYFSLNPQSIEVCSLWILQDRSDSWSSHLMDFVDHFRSHPNSSLVEAPPSEDLDEPLRCLLASTVEYLCGAANLDQPEWCKAVEGLSQPWFVSGIENLKATALMESPAEFRKRNIFVLGNFLDRV